MQLTAISHRHRVTYYYAGQYFVKCLTTPSMLGTPSNFISFKQKQNECLLGIIANHCNIIKARDKKNVVFVVWFLHMKMHIFSELNKILES